jgi:RHS repeat-associated protein
VKTTIDSAGVQRHTVDVFGNYKLRLTKPSGTGTLADYTLDQTTEQVELQSHGVTVGRVEVIPSTASTLTTPGQRTLLVLHDALGSAGIVLDKSTGQLAEAITYTAYGQTESDYRPPRFSSNREDERFTGKEEDVEIGLVYFGKRYLVPAMARWASADPLAVHAPGEADLNLYAYVHGRVYVAVDPNGLEDKSAAPGSVANPIATNEVPRADVDIKAGEVFKFDPKSPSGVKRFDDAGAADAEMGGDWFRYDPYAAWDWESAQTIRQMWRGQKTTGDSIQTAVHPLESGSSAGRTGGIADGACDTCGGNEAIQALDSAWSAMSLAATAKATIGAIKAFGSAAVASVSARLESRAVQIVAPAKRASGTTVLGHYPEYMELADSKGHRRFDIPMKAWNKMSDAERWSANQKFLDRTISRGDEIVLSTPLQNVKPGSYFERELQYLSGKGYRPSVDGKSLVRGGE